MIYNDKYLRKLRIKLSVGAYVCTYMMNNYLTLKYKSSEIYFGRPVI